MYSVAKNTSETAHFTKSWSKRPVRAEDHRKRREPTGVLGQEGSRPFLALHTHFTRPLLDMDSNKKAARRVKHACNWRCTE